MSDDTQSSLVNLTIPQRAWKIFHATCVGVIAAQLLAVAFLVTGVYGRNHEVGEFTSRWGILPFSVFAAITMWPTAKLLWGRVGPRGARTATWFAQVVRVLAVFIWLSLGLNLLTGNVAQVLSCYAAFVFVVAFFGQLRDEWSNPAYAKSYGRS